MVDIVTVTSKGQITIPSQLRKELNITKGGKLLVIREGDSIRIIPVPKLSRLAGVDKHVFESRQPSKDIEAMRREWTREFEERI